MEGLFERRLIVKLINGRPLTAHQLDTYVKTYCSLFREVRCCCDGCASGCRLPAWPAPLLT